MPTRAQISGLVELTSRRMDGLAMVRLAPFQIPVVSDPHSEVLIAGGNRASKSFCAAVRFASIARDMPVRAMDGSFIDCRLPHQKGRPLIMWVIGDHLKHIGQNIHRFLFRSGLYYIIRDENTGGWRAWNPLQFPNDWNRLDERKPSMPLIPHSEIDQDNSAWYNKGLRQFEKITLNNGTEIYAFASAGEEMQGVPIDEGWFDENIVLKRWYAEVLNRTTDKSGRVTWSTIPRDNCFVFTEVEERAAAQQQEVDEGHREPEDQFCVHHILTQTANPFLPQKQKDIRMQQMSERDRLIRIEGVRSTDVTRIYQSFNPDFHCVEYRDPAMNDAITAILRENNWEPPNDWCRYLTLDPGTQKPAVLATTVPPPELWDEGEPYIIPYAEIYRGRMDAYAVATAVNEQHFGHFFEQWIIDGKAASQQPMGFAWTIGRQYEIEFAKMKLRSRHGVYFTPGDPNFMQRSGLVHKAMRMRRCGKPQLRIVTQRCPQLVKQLMQNTRKLDPMGEPTEEPAKGQYDDLRETLEYTVSRHPTYVSPPHDQNETDPALKRYEEWQKEARRRSAKPSSERGILCGAIG